MSVSTSKAGGFLRGLRPVIASALIAGFALALTLPAAAQDAPPPAPVEPVPGAEGLIPAEAPAIEEAVVPPTVDPDAVVATVNGEPITERDLGVTAQIMGEQLTQYPEENWREIVIQVAIESRLIAMAAEAEALDDDVNFQTEMALIRERLLQEDYIQQFIVPQVTEEDLNAAYQAAIAGMNLPQEVLIRHIMVATEAEANEVLTLLGAGADFAALAQERSLDRVTAEVGGLIDNYWAPGELIQEFDDVVFTIPTGENLPFPVAFDGNWHVIHVDDRRLRSPPAYEELRDALQQQLVAQAYTEAVTALREQGNVEIVGAPAEGDAAPADAAPPAEAAPVEPPPAEAAPPAEAPPVEPPPAPAGP